MLPPLSDAQWPDEIAELQDGFAGRLNVYRVMARHPALLRAWCNLRNHVVLNSTLTSMQSEVIILRTGLRRRSPYEWAHHVSRGLSVGLSHARIAAIADETPEPGDQLLIEAVDSLIDHNKIAIDIAGKLQAAIGIEGVLDLIATVGMYTTLAYVIETFGVPLDDDIEPAGLPIPKPFASTAQIVD